MIEKHFTDDCARTGPDHLFAMDPNSWKEMVERTRELELALGGGIKKVELNEKDTVIVQRRALRAVRDLQVGHVIAANDFVPLRPCPSDAISPAKHAEIIGERLRSKVLAGEYIKERDFL